MHITLITHNARYLSFINLNILYKYIKCILFVYIYIYCQDLIIYSYILFFIVINIFLSLISLQYKKHIYKFSKNCKYRATGTYVFFFVVKNRDTNLDDWSDIDHDVRFFCGNFPCFVNVYERSLLRINVCLLYNYILLEICKTHTFFLCIKGTQRHYQRN